jgi:hypothetical protein
MLANGMKMWKGIGNTTALLFSLNGPMKYMIVLPEFMVIAQGIVNIL